MKGCVQYGFLPKRAKAVAEGRVIYRIYDGDLVVFENKNFIVAVQYADKLQQSAPDKRYVMKIEEIS